MYTRSDSSIGFFEVPLFYKIKASRVEATCIRSGIIPPKEDYLTTTDAVVLLYMRFIIGFFIIFQAKIIFSMLASV